jgi:hypothetical protein
VLRRKVRTTSSPRPSVIPPSTITIVKNAVGGNDTFNYTTTGGGGLPPSFSINTSVSTQSVNSGINPGLYTVTESTPPTGWTFQPPITCTVTGGATAAPDATTNTKVNITIPSTGGATVTCTYTNSLSTTPSIATTLHNNADNSTVVYDTASVTDSGFAFTGTVTFRFYSTKSDCSGDFTDETGVAVGDPSSAGGYSFQAKYVAGSDANHNDSDWSACEPLTIGPATPNISTVVKDANGTRSTTARTRPPWA